MKYKSKVSEIEAVFYNGSNKAEVENFLDTHCTEYNDTLPFIRWGDNGLSMLAYCGEYIIKLPNGKIFTIWNEIFDELFERIKDENNRTD